MKQRQLLAPVVLLCLLTQTSTANDQQLDTPATETLPPSTEQRLALAESRLASLEQQNSLEDRVRINGFISFAMERTSNNVKNASGDPLNYRGVDDSWDTRRLSRAGVQFNARIDDRTEAVVQLLARGDAANDYNVDAQWAYIAYDINPDLTARAGRLVLPFYLHSQYFQAGYAYPWIELPAEVYGRIPKETHEGIDLVWRTGTGPVSHNVNLFWGSMDVEGINGVYEVRNQTGLNIRSQWQNWTSFIGYTFSDVSLPLPDQSGAGFYDFSPLSLDEAYAYFATAGIQYDNGRLLVMAETTQLGINSEENWFPKTPSRYLTVGYRFGQWMPHLTWAQSEARGKNCPQTLASAACVLYSDVGYRQKSWTLGTRYELTPGVALKAEASRYYDFSNDSINTSGYFENPALPLLIDPPVNDNPLVFRIAVEAVF